MQPKFLYSIASKGWNRLQECGNVYLNSSYIALVYQIKENDQDVYIGEVRITLVEPITKIQTTEEKKIKMLKLQHVKEFIARTNSLTNLNGKTSIFKFNSNEDFPFFVEWSKKRESDLQIELEKIPE